MPISAPDVTEETAPGDGMTTDAQALADLKRSSPLVISISQLAASWGWSRSATARRLDKWVSEGHISKSITHGRTLRLACVPVPVPVIPERVPTSVPDIPEAAETRVETD